MAKKLVAVFVMCIVVLAAFHVPETEAMGEVFKECYTPCKNECVDSGKMSTYCEMKCDSECGAKEFTDELNDIKT